MLRPDPGRVCWQGEECQTPDSSDGHLIKALLSPRPSQLLESAETVNT